MMFANKYLDKQISYKCAIFSDETTLRRLCKPLISRLYNAHTRRCSSVQYATFKTLSAAAKTTKSRHCHL